MAAAFCSALIGFSAGVLVILGTDVDRLALLPIVVGLYSAFIFYVAATAERR